MNISKTNLHFGQLDTNSSDTTRGLINAWDIAFCCIVTTGEREGGHPEREREQRGKERELQIRQLSQMSYFSVNLTAEGNHKQKLTWELQKNLN